MLLLGEGGESKLGTNVNYLIEEYGVSVNSDCVVRTVMPDSPISVLSDGTVCPSHLGQSTTAVNGRAHGAGLL